MRSALIGAVLTAVLAACGSPPGVVFRTTVSNPNGEFPLLVTLGDQTDLVVGIGPASVDPADFRDAGILPDPSGPSAFILTWLGGMCDNDVALAFRQTDAGYDIGVSTHGKLGFGGCPAAGILRAVRIETSEPVPVRTIAISGSKAIQLILDEDCGPLRAAETNDAKLACNALIDATIGNRTADFAQLNVAPDDGACPGTECSTAEGIAGQLWRVEATDRQGLLFIWRCTYRDEAASCSAVAESSSS